MGRKAKHAKKKTPLKLETVKAVVEILAGMANIAFIVYQILKG